MTVSLHALAEEIAAEQVAYCKSIGLTAKAANRVFFLNVECNPGKETWDKVHDAFARCWLLMRARRRAAERAVVAVSEAA